MSVSQQRRIIAVSSMVVFAMGFVSIINKGRTPDEATRFFIGVGIAYTIVSILSDMGSELGAGFAILIMLAAFIKEGDTVFGFLLQRGRSKAARKADNTVRKTLKKEDKPFTRQTVFPNFSGPQFN